VIDLPPPLRDVSYLTAWGAIAGIVTSGAVAIVQSVCNTIERIVNRDRAAKATPPAVQPHD
jgi:hypothetical protein